MLIATVDFAVSPADHGAALATLQAEAPVVRARPGNLAYTLWADPAQAGSFRLMHEWTDAFAFEAYRASEGFKAVGGVLFPLMVGAPTSRVFDANPALK